MEKGYLENADGFNFINGQPAYCSECGKGVGYKIISGAAFIPKKCPNCYCYLDVKSGKNPKGTILIGKNEKITND